MWTKSDRLLGGCYAAFPALQFDVDFLRLFRHNERTSLVKSCVLVNTTLPLFSEQSREVFYFSGCGFRAAVEKCFDDLKNDLDMKRLRVHASGRMKNRMFIQFVSLILTSQILRTIREKLPSSKYTPKSLLLELESLTIIHYTGKYKDLLTEATKSQREILEAFGVGVQS